VDQTRNDLGIIVTKPWNTIKAYTYICLMVCIARTRWTLLLLLHVYRKQLLKFTILHCTTHGNRNHTCIALPLDSYKFINLPLQFLELNLDRILRVRIYSRMVV